MEAASVLLQTAITLGLAALMELVVAAAYTRRKVRKDVQVAVSHAVDDVRALVQASQDAVKVQVAALEAKLDARPALLKSGVDPSAAAAARWEKKAEEEATKDDALIGIHAVLVERFGPNARSIWEWIPEETRAAIVRAGPKWQHRLEPLLRGFKKHESTKVQVPGVSTGVEQEYG